MADHITISKQLTSASSSFTPTTSTTTLSHNGPDPTVKGFTTDECIYHVNTSSAQKALYGFLGTSLIVNLILFLWWLRLYVYKRKKRRQARDDDNTESQSGDAEKGSVYEPRELELPRGKSYGHDFLPSHGVTVEKTVAPRSARKRERSLNVARERKRDLSESSDDSDSSSGGKEGKPRKSKPAYAKATYAPAKAESKSRAESPET